MRYDPNGSTEGFAPYGTVYLSEHNLLSLLAKLNIEDSARTIWKDGIAVVAENDDVHYHGGHIHRRPGLVSEETQAMVDLIKSDIDAYVKRTIVRGDDV